MTLLCLFLKIFPSLKCLQQWEYSNYLRSVINTSLNSDAPGQFAMHAIFRHTKLSDSDVAQVKSGNYPASTPTLGEGIYYVYNMGNYWNGGGHNGGSQWNNLINNDHHL